MNTFNALVPDCGRDQEKKSKVDKITISIKNEAFFNFQENQGKICPRATL